MQEQRRVIINNNISPNTFLILIIFSFILFLVCFLQVANTFVSTKDYVKVYAQKSKLTNVYNYRTESYDHFVEFNYSYNGNNYTSKEKVLLPFLFNTNNHHKNSTKIYINPENPSKIRNNYTIKVVGSAGLVAILFHVFCIKAYKVRKNVSNGNEAFR